MNHGLRGAWRRIGLVMALSLGTVLGAQAAPSQRPERVVLVIQMGGPNRPVDEAVAKHLTERGFAVELVDQKANPEVAKDAALVVISSTVSGKDVDARWRQLPVPLLTWENDILDDLAMTGKRHDVDFGDEKKERYLWIVNAPHPMAGGLPAGVANVYIKQAGMGWGHAAPGATIIATIYGQPDKAAIFGYEKGASMDYEAIAPARRVMFSLDNNTFTNLSATGLSLFDAAIDWTVGRR